jgi:hypothetical protein
MVVDRVSGTEGLPRNNGTLFRRLTTVLWEREQKRRTPGLIPYEQAEARFASLAYTMIDESRPTDVARDFAIAHIGDPWLLQAGIGASFFEATNDKIHFYHQLMLEYFAGVQLLRVGVGERVRSPTFVGPDAFSTLSGVRRNAGAWDQAIIAACGIAPNPDAMVSSVATANPYLALECLASGVLVSDSVRIALLHSLIADIRWREREIANIEEAYRAEPEKYGGARGRDEKDAFIYGREQIIDEAKDHIRAVGASLSPLLIERVRIGEEDTPFLLECLELIDPSQAVAQAMEFHRGKNISPS